MAALSHATCRAVICCQRVQTPLPPEIIDEGRRRETRTSRGQGQAPGHAHNAGPRDPRSMRVAVTVTNSATISVRMVVSSLT
jgi:hypothetical protein